MYKQVIKHQSAGEGYHGEQWSRIKAEAERGKVYYFIGKGIAECSGKMELKDEFMLVQKKKMKAVQFL